MRRTIGIWDKVDVGGSDSWQHVWDCICFELGIEE